MSRTGIYIPGATVLAQKGASAVYRTCGGVENLPAVNMGGAHGGGAGWDTRRGATEWGIRRSGVKREAPWGTGGGLQHTRCQGAGKGAH